MPALCSACGFNNPPGMRFCGNCGTRLEGTPVAAPAPQADIKPFTPEFGVMIGADLAERLHRAGIEATGQRRNVTVLFADITGFTALSQRIDGEDLYNMIQDFVRVLSSNVYKYEGVVDKITGDGIMALYGAPISHENNAERALRSAIDMQADLEDLKRSLKQKLDFDLYVRIGLHSGSVIVGGIGSNLLMNYTAIGDTVNLASRIEEAAPPGSILISEAVYRQVRSFTDCQQISVMHAKGIDHPVVAYRVIGLKEQPGAVRGIEGLHAPMIGRDDELKQLMAAAWDLLENGRGQFALVTGEAGLGKSRLTNEFRLSLDPTRVMILHAQSLAYRRVSYWLARELMYCYLNLPSTTPPLQVRERLSRYVYQRVGLNANEMLTYLEHLMALPYSDPSAGERLRRVEASQLRQQIFLAVRDLFLVEARYHPLLLVLDDLHWADDASLELFHFLLESIRASPIYILAITRQVPPGPLERSIAWVRQNLPDRFHEIDLHQLSPDQTSRLLNLLLSIPNLPIRLHDQIIQRAAGVPFYLEEILRMLIDRGIILNQEGSWLVAEQADVANLGVPDTLQELILARFDRLPPDYRRVLQVAAVIGKDFSLPVLGGVLRTHEVIDLHRLVDDLVVREFILPGVAETEFTFRHILMSDAIYSTMLRKERSLLHGQVAEAIENIYADRLDEHVELLANHYRWSPYLDRALHYLLLAGRKAARNQVNQQASQLFETARTMLEQVEHSNRQAFEVYSGLGDTQMFAGEYPKARSYYLQALQVLSAQEAEFLEERSSLHRRTARTYERVGDYDQAQAFLGRAQQILDEDPEAHPVERALVWNDLAWIHFRRGSLGEAGSLLHMALRLVEDSDAYDVIASIYNRLGGVAFIQGDWERATAYLRRSIAIREETRDLVNLATSLNNLGLLELEIGNLDGAHENLTRCLELKTRLGQAEGIALALVNLGWLLIQRGDLEAARRNLERAAALAEQIRYSSLLGQIYKNMAELNLVDEDWKSARHYIENYLAVIDSGTPTENLAECYRLLGDAALGDGRIEDAEGWAERAGQVLHAIGGEHLAPSAPRGDVLRLQGMLAIQKGDWLAAEELLHQAQENFREMGSVLGEGRVIFRLGCLAQARGDATAAREHFQSAYQIFEKVGARLDCRRTEQALLNL